MPATAEAETTTTTTMNTATKEPLGFLDSLSDLGDASLETPKTSETKTTTATADPAQMEPLKVPEKVTQDLTGQTVEKKETAAAPEEWEKEADELFKTKQGEAFAKLKSQLKELRPRVAQVDQLTKDLAEAKKAGASSVELEAIKQERDRLATQTQEQEKELSLTRVEATQEYKNAVTSLHVTVKDGVSALAKQYEVPEDGLHAALRETDPAKRSQKLTEAGREMTEYDRMKFYQLAEKHDLAMQRETAVRANAAESLKLIEANRAKAAEAQAAGRSEEYKAALAASGQDMGKIPLFQKVEGNEDWNKRLDTMNEWCQNLDVSALPPRELATLVRQSAAFITLLDTVEFYAKEAATAKAELGKYVKATPGAGSGARTGEVMVKPNAGKDVGFVEALEMGLGSR